MLDNLMREIFGWRWKGFGSSPEYKREGSNPAQQEQQDNFIMPQSAPSPTIENNPFKEKIKQLEKQYNLPPNIMAALVHSESSFSPKAKI